jgi:hypothetical protein
MGQGAQRSITRAYSRTDRCAEGIVGQGNFTPACCRDKESGVSASGRQAGGHTFQAVQHVVWRRDDQGLHAVHDLTWGPVNWVTFEVEGGGRVAVQLQHVVALYDEQGSVKLATTASGVHVLKDTTVQRAVMIVSAAADAEAARTG